MNWRESAGAITWEVAPFVDGRYRSSTAKETFDTVNPSMETVLSRPRIGCSEDVDEAVRVARRRFDQGGWSDLPPAQRVEILVRLAERLAKHKEELALLDSLEMGKPVLAGLYDAETFAPGYLRGCAGFVDKLMGVNATASADALAFNLYEPRGVVGAITAWNFPIVNAVIKVGPALAAGNTVVLKPSEIAPSSALKLAELALDAGIPEGVLNVVPGLGSTVGTALAAHPDVDLISFTGSTATGRRIMEMCGRSNGKPLLLECGGKSPQVVFDDADDLDAVAEATVKSFVRNSGQVCSAHTRLIVQERIKERLLEKIVERARQCQPGDPLDEKTMMGPLASPGQRDRLRRYVEEGIEAGADPVLRGRIQESGGCYVAPTIFDRVRPCMSIAKEEIFGPVLCVLSFRTDEEAVELANGTDYGLAATVWTRDLARASRLSRSIRAGHISVRTSGEEDLGAGCVLSREPQKASGFGAESGLRGLQAYSTLKSIVFSGV